MNCAIYIDADNVSYKSLDEIILRAKDSNVIIKKIFADWSQDSMKKWAIKSKKYGFQGIQCFGNDRKQTSDIYMITDVINDIYSNKNIEMVILATSDIDFTHLCHLIKSKNKKLVIFTPQKSNITNLENKNNFDNQQKKQKIDDDNYKTNNKKIKLNDNSNDILEYLIEGMKDCMSIYISKYKKNLKKIVPKNINIDINHIDKVLIKFPKHFGIIRKGNKIKIYGLFHLHKLSEDEIKNNQEDIENKYQEIFKVFEFKKIIKKIS